MFLSPPMGADPKILVILGTCATLLTCFTLLIRTMRNRHHPAAGELMARTQTFWWMLGLISVALLISPLWMFGLLWGLSVLGFVEFLGFLKAKIPRRLKRTLVLMTIPCAASAYYFAFRDNYLGFVTLSFVPLLMVAPMVFVLFQQVENALVLMGGVTLGVAFFVCAIGHAGFLIHLQVELFLLVLVFTELRDLFSYWCGKFFGKWAQKNPSSAFLAGFNQKIAPQVSPNKTWGTGILSCLFTLGLAWGSQSLIPHVARLPQSGWLIPLWGFVLGWSGLFGDLAFSLFKRDAGLKDSGSMFPGHSGVIDRIDSLVFTFPVSMHVFYWLSH